MKIVETGHVYELANANEGTQFIRFMAKFIEPGFDHDGTTNEEVLAMMIDRMKYLNNILPSRETSLAITKLEEALMWLNARTADRLVRGVEGTQNP